MVGGVVVVVVVLDKAGFQMLNCQKLGSVIAADSASVQKIINLLFSFKNQFVKLTAEIIATRCS